MEDNESIFDHYAEMELDHQTHMSLHTQDHSDEDDVAEQGKKVIISAEEIIENNDNAKMNLLTNFNVEEFKDLYQCVQPALESRMHRDVQLAGKTKFLLALFFCKFNETFEMILLNFGIKMTYAHQVILSTIEKTYKILLLKYVRWISVSQRITEYNIILPDGPTLLGSLDATVQPINRPKVDQQLYYSGKHKQHCMKTQALVSPTGLLIHFSESVPGSVHDFTLFKNSNLKLLIEQENAYYQGLFNSNCTTLADAGYQGLTNLVPGSIPPHKKPRNGNLSDQQKEFNKKTSHRRILVENYFGRLKTLWKIMATKYRLKLSSYGHVWCFCASLTNYHISLHPLRERYTSSSSSSSDEEDN